MEPQIPQALNKFNLKKMWPYVLGAFLVVVAGVGSAWVLSSRMTTSGDSSKAAPGAKVTSNEAGLLDPKVEYVTATGVLKVGGVGNEGTHHLERDGGPSQTVYLTSSVVDLESFVDKKVDIWGETLSSKKAGWLMDVH